MGAFVGNVTSRSLWRRKGRVGRDVIIPLTAPTYAGAAIPSLAANHEAVICSLGAADGTYQVSRDFGASAWQSVNLPAPPNSRLGYSAVQGETSIKVRPFSERMDLDLWHLQLQFMGAGQLIGTGGSLYEIRPDGRTNKTNFNVPGQTMHVGAWSDDGRCYLVCGDNAAGAVVTRGNITDDGADAPQSFSYSVVPVNATCQGVFNFQESGGFRNRYMFMTHNAGGVGTGMFKQIFRRIPQNDWTNGINIDSPGNEAAAGWFLQVRDKLMAFSDAGSMLFAISPFNAFTEVVIAAGNAVKGSFRMGNRIYAVLQGAPNRIRVSHNLGATWVASNAQPGDAGVQFSATTQKPFTGEVFLVGNDGAVNRFYRFRPFLDI